ncbi:hypothetical protein RHMOL_Rhmol10G0227000 [Rhododendron molle]|uniref:Uncharacterized protein n=1 Tax=Rhododendron molle TaxID=49168 RepID=A0ACC0M4X7_RHOML|nr:hypothetical protein RHMOL_Rhmol10G0227000 [Rhododendron molle]
MIYNSMAIRNSLSLLPSPLSPLPKLSNPSTATTALHLFPSPRLNTLVTRSTQFTVSNLSVAVGEDLPEDYADWLPKPDPFVRRRAGVLLHPTSFPGSYGMGDLGEQAFRFIDWLHDAGCSLWQVLPLVPPGRKGNEDGSPYSGQDANCGNTLLISLEELVNDGLLMKEELPKPIDGDRVNYSTVADVKDPLIAKALIEKGLSVSPRSVLPTAGPPIATDGKIPSPMSWKDMVAPANPVISRVNLHFCPPIVVDNKLCVNILEAVDSAGVDSLQGDEGQVSLENSGGDPITLPIDEEFDAGLILDLTSMVSPPKKKGRGCSKGVKKPMKDGDSVASLPSGLGDKDKVAQLAVGTVFYINTRAVKRPLDKFVFRNGRYDIQANVFRWHTRSEGEVFRKGCLASAQGVSLENSGGDPITIPTDEEFDAGMTLDLTSMVSPPKKKGRGCSKGVKKPMKDGDSVASLPSGPGGKVDTNGMDNHLPSKPEAKKDGKIPATKLEKDKRDTSSTKGLNIPWLAIIVSEVLAIIVFEERLRERENSCRRMRKKAAKRLVLSEGDLKCQLEEFKKDPDVTSWLEDAAYFAAIDNHLDTFSWYNWPEPLKNRHLAALEEIYQSQKDFIDIFIAQQFLFERQWKKVRDYAQLRGISVMGDMPIYVGYHSADVWAHKKQFWLNRSGFPLLVSGVPPDAFSETGQLWGSPLYDWKAMENYGYSWWICRLRRAQNLFDEFRIDHFRGFAGFWAVPSEAKIAMVGRWKELRLSGVSDLVVAIQNGYFWEGVIIFKYGPEAEHWISKEVVLCFILNINNRGRRGYLLSKAVGVITEDVVDLRKSIGAPGMAVLQFGFGSDSGNPHLPHNHEYNQVVYTGTHDNDTIQGWWDNLQQEEKSNVLEYLSISGEDISWALIRAALSSVARTAIIPMQDILGLGSSARMNIPATQFGNWSWRIPSSSSFDCLGTEARKLRAMLSMYGRL